MEDLKKETGEALDTAFKAVEALQNDMRPDTIKRALVAILDVCSQLARLAGVPNAIEPDDDGS